MTKPPLHWRQAIQKKPDADFRPALDACMWFTQATPAQEELIAYVPPRAPQVPLHYHPFTETFTVLEGQLDVLVGDTWQTFTTGQTATVPPGTIHSFQNRSDQPCYYRGRVTPGGRFLDMMRTYDSLVSCGKFTSPRSVRSLSYLGLLYLNFRDVQVMTGPIGSLLYTLGTLNRWLGGQLPCHRYKRTLAQAASVLKN